MVDATLRTTDDGAGSAAVAGDRQSLAIPIDATGRGDGPALTLGGLIARARTPILSVDMCCGRLITAGFEHGRSASGIR